jgi:GT2 family glycosyltransferase
MMQLSVVIPTLNKVALLTRTLEALRRQETAPDLAWEVVVVNDGSSDGTAGFLAAQAGWQAPSLQVVSPAQNVGRARARNLGARAAQGAYLLFLDDDIVAPVDLIAAHLRLVAAHPGCGTIGYARTAPELIDGPHFYYLDSRGTARLPEGPAPSRYFVTQNAAVPREAFLAIGGFDEEFSAYGFEDMEVAFRLEDAGLKFRTLTAPVPLHVHHHSFTEYFVKRQECGRHSLPHLARLHPARLAEMQLHHVVDGPAGRPRGALSRVIRGVAASPLAEMLRRLLRTWPTGAACRPRLAGLYQRLMNLAVLCAYRQGVTDSRR